MLAGSKIHTLERRSSFERKALLASTSGENIRFPPSVNFSKFQPGGSQVPGCSKHRGACGSPSCAMSVSALFGIGPRVSVMASEDQSREIHVVRVVLSFRDSWYRTTSGLRAQRCATVWLSYRWVSASSSGTVVGPMRDMVLCPCQKIWNLCYPRAAEGTGKRGVPGKLPRLV